MIRFINIQKTATYTSCEVNPTKINYIYGSNGSGKTTLSRIISEPSKYPNANITWSSGELETRVYNRDFVKLNFQSNNKIKGIFTLGEENIENQQKIDSLINLISQKRHTISTQETSLKVVQETFDAKKLALNKKLKDVLNENKEVYKDALYGFISDLDKFEAKLFGYFEIELKDVDEEIFKSNLKSAFSKDVDAIPNINPLSSHSLELISNIENNPIFEEEIVGRIDSSLSILIEKLQHSDWVSKGLGLQNKYEITECPFCQKPIEPTLQEEIQSLFDQSYVEKCSEIEALKTNYINHYKTIIDSINSIADHPNFGFEKSSIAQNIELLKQSYRHNLDKINEKINSISQKIQLNPSKEHITPIVNWISDCNKRISEHNEAILKKSSLKISLRNDIWHIIAKKHKKELIKFSDALNGPRSGLKNIKDKIQTIHSEIVAHEADIRTLESKITSTEHTVNEINKILSAFHFKGFKLATSADKTFYKIIREDGNDVQDSLSEGEMTFITFLYFYQSLMGSIESSGIGRQKVIVIDDPISSLDSNILFIVSNLVKSVIKDAKENKNGFEQIFVSTHNIYFHKEITFLGSRENPSEQETYWVIRKSNNVSSIIIENKNQISTAYDLLWKEIRNPDQTNNITIFNTLRRILEYYFKIIGNLKYEDRIQEFDPADQLAVRALISWINDGSHFVNDDLLVEVEMETKERYLEIFRKIFEHFNHLSHYEMMMNK